MISTRTVGLRWSASLLELLLEELYADDSFFTLMGKPEELAIRRYPQAVAVAIALRHSWRQDDLSELAGRLGVRLVNPAKPR